MGRHGQSSLAWSSSIHLVTGVDGPNQLQGSAAGFLDYGKCQATLIIGFATCLSCNYIINKDHKAEDESID